METPQDRPVATRARAWAVLLSIFLPGLGELYAGRPDSALESFVIFYALAAVIVALVYVPSTVALLATLLVGILAWVIVLTRAARAAARAPQPFPPHAYDRWYWYGAIILVSVFFWHRAVANQIQQHWIGAYQIPSDAMYPTILPGDFVLASMRRGHFPHQNDLVVYESPTGNGGLQIKRVVGLPGDTLAMHGGSLIRNGVTVAEPFTTLLASQGDDRPDLEGGVTWQIKHLVNRPARGTVYRPDMRNWGPVVIPRDSVFVLGDNRDASFDSRFWGALAVKQLRGRPLVVYFSIDRNAPGVRWSRIGQRF